MMAPSDIFRDRMRALRKARGWSQADLLKRAQLGWSQHSDLSRLENGGRHLRLDDAVSIAQAFGLTIAEMLDDSTICGAEIDRASADPPWPSGITCQRLLGHDDRHQHTTKGGAVVEWMA